MAQPILFILNPITRVRLSALGTPPLMPAALTPPISAYSIAGITKNSAGVALGSCAVDLFLTAGDVIVDRVTSSSSTGAYSFSVGLGSAYYIVAYKSSLLTSYRAEVLADSPDVYLRLDDSGTTFVDIANGHNLTTSGTIISAASLLVSDADASAKFDPASTLAHATSTYSVSQIPLTVEFWIKPQSLVGSGGNNSHIVSCADPAGLGGWAVEINQTTGEYWMTYSGAGFNQFTGSAVAVVGTTQHVVFVMRTAIAIDLYINGVFQQTLATGTLGATTRNLCVGRQDTNGTSFPSATIDEVAIYKSSLSATRIAAHYAAGASSPDVTGATVNTLKGI